MNPLDKQWFYRGFRKQLRAELGSQKAEAVWRERPAEVDKWHEKRPFLLQSTGSPESVYFARREKSRAFYPRRSARHREADSGIE